MKSHSGVGVSGSFIDITSERKKMRKNPHFYWKKRKRSITRHSPPQVFPQAVYSNEATSYDNTPSSPETRYHINVVQNGTLNVKPASFATGFYNFGSAHEKEGGFRGANNSKKSLSHFSRRFLEIRKKNLKNLKKNPKNPKNLKKKVSKIPKILEKSWKKIPKFPNSQTSWKNPQKSQKSSEKYHEI